MNLGVSPRYKESEWVESPGGRVWGFAFVLQRDSVQTNREAIDQVVDWINEADCDCIDYYVSRNFVYMDGINGAFQFKMRWC